jgi:hypothetical protein
MRSVDVDPDLERQLAVAKRDEPVEAVLLLRHADSHSRPPIDAEALMERVHNQDHSAEIHYLPGIGALVIRARPDVIRRLISRPEVEMASANRIAGDVDL